MKWVLSPQEWSIHDWKKVVTPEELISMIRASHGQSKVDTVFVNRCYGGMQLWGKNWPPVVMSCCE